MLSALQPLHRPTCLALSFKQRPHLHTRAGRSGLVQPKLVRKQRPCVLNSLPVPIDGASTQAIAGVTAAVGSSVALLWKYAKNWRGGMANEVEETSPQESPPVPRENAVLVFGATGKTGRLVATELLNSGRTVVAAARDVEKAQKTYGELGLKEGKQDNSDGTLILEAGVDVTDPSTLRAELFEGVTQVVMTLGPVFGRTPDGQMGYLNNMTSERVDAEGVKNTVAAAKSYLSAASQQEATLVLPMKTPEDFSLWGPLDDVIMGGKSKSELRASEDGSGAVWSGELIEEGGGFCGARTRVSQLDMSAYDGIALRVKGDGQTFKLNIKTLDQAEMPESTYQAQFDTVAGEWTTVRIPWREFVPVQRARFNPAAPPLDPARICQLGLVLSRFEYNGYPNLNYRPGNFELQLKDGFMGFKDPRPAVVMLTSAGVERNAIIGDDAEARKRDIPIVQLNPGGVLNYKYAGEAAVRYGALPYSIVRATGLTDEVEGGPFLLEFSQGDQISGKVGRAEIAAVMAAALASPAAAGKTVEVRRSEAAGDKGKATTPEHLQRLFLAAALDRRRPAAGLQPFPAVVPPPPPPSEERKQEILADERVQQARAAGRGGRVRSETETAAAGSVTVVGDGRADATTKVKPPAEASAAPKASTPGNGAEANGAEDEAAQRAADARAWIDNWRASSPEKAPVEAKEKVSV